jgi:hypothetical protein
MPAEHNIEGPALAAGDSDQLFVTQLGATWRSVLDIGHYSGVVNRGVEKCRIMSKIAFTPRRSHFGWDWFSEDYGKTTS